MSRQTVKLSVILLSALLLSSCATPKIQLASTHSVPLPQPSAMALNIHATQILTATANKKTYTTQVAVEVTPKHINIVALGAWGGQLFSINYDGHNIASKSLPIKHAGIGIQQTLTDFIFTYAPTSALKQALKSTDIRLTANAKQRVFSIHGKPIIKITYQHNNHWQGRVVLKNLIHHYSIKIQTVSVKQNTDSRAQS